MQMFRIFVVLILLASSGLSHAVLDIQHWQTSQGTRVYFVETHDLPIIDLRISFNAGSAYDDPDKLGVSSVTSYLMRLGADGMSDADIARGFADVGAVMSSNAAKDSTSFSLRTLSSAQEKQASMALLNKILHQPDFPEAVLSREKSRYIAGLQESDTNPESITSKAFVKALYRDHPYVNDALETVESIEAISRQDLVAFYQQYYNAKNAVIAMIGDMTQAEAKTVAENLVKGLPKGSAAKSLPPLADLAQAADERIKHPATQAHVMLGAPGIARDDADIFALSVGNYILGGGGFVSRLTEEVREKEGMVYSVYSYFSPRKQRGPFLINFQTKKSQVNEALDLVKETLSDFIVNGVTPEELEAAKANMIGGFPMKIDSNKKILRYLSAIGFYDLPLDYLETYNDKIAAVTAEQIKAAFQMHLNPEKMVTIVVGDAAK